VAYSFATVDGGGTEQVFSGAAVSFTTLSSGGAIDVPYLSYVTGGSTSVTSTGLLTVSVGGHLYMQQLAGDDPNQPFQLARDAGSGTLITAEGPPCFLAGTRILTARGEVPVEALRVGDQVWTVLGKRMLQIIWIGQRDVDCAGHATPRQVWPVRVATGTFGPGRPHTDMFLSPNHAIYVNEVLIPVKHLINDSTIVQVKVDRVTYHHIELAEHDVVLAQGLPAERFLDVKDGSKYANRPGPVRLHPDYSVGMWEAFGCARLVVTGPELEAARALVGSFATDRAAA